MQGLSLSGLAAQLVANGSVPKTTNVSKTDSVSFSAPIGKTKDVDGGLFGINFATVPVDTNTAGTSLEQTQARMSNFFAAMKEFEQSPEGQILKAFGTI